MTKYQSVRRNPSFLGMPLRDSKSIPDSPVCPNEFLLEVAIHLVAQPGDKHIHNIGLRIKIIAPYMLHDHGLGQNSPGVPHEVRQQGKFLRLELNSLTGAKNITGQKIQREVFHHELGRFGSLACPANQCIDARQELRKGEWLGQVVVTARLKSFDAIIHGSLRAQNKHGRLNFLLSHLLDHAQSIELGKHHVHNGCVVGLGKSELEPVRAIIGMIHNKPRLSQPLHHERGNLSVIFHYEDSHREDALSPTGKITVKNTENSTSAQTEKQRGFENRTSACTFPFDDRGSRASASQTNSFFGKHRSKTFEIISHVANRIWKSGEPVLQSPIYGRFGWDRFRRKP